MSLGLPSRPSTGASRTPRLPPTRQSSASHRRQLGLPLASPEVQPKLVAASLTELLRRPADQFHSKILEYEEAYATMLVMISNAAAPNPLRTAFSSAVLHTLIEESNFFPEGARNLLRNIKNDLLCSVFLDTTSHDFETATGTIFSGCPSPSSSSAASSVFSKPQYATSIDNLRQECAAMKTVLHTKTTTTKNEARLMEAVVSRWQRMLVDRIFQSWRNFTKRRRAWVSRTDLHVVKRDHRTILRRCLVAWKAETAATKQAKFLRDTEARFEALQQNEASLVKEYSRVVAGVEKLQMEKRELQDFIRRQTEELTAAKLLVDQLNARLEQSRNATNNWKDAATYALRLIGPAGNALAVARGSVSASAGSRSNEGRHSEVAEPSQPGALVPSNSTVVDFLAQAPASDVDTGLLQAVNHLLELTPPPSQPIFFSTDRRHSAAPSPKSRKASLMFLPRSVSNFTTDFSDGLVLATIAMNVGVFDKEEGHRAMDDLPTAKLIELALTKLEQYCGILTAMVSPLDIQMSSQPNALKLFLLKVLSVSTHACPLCSAVSSASRAESRRASTASTEPQREALLTASDIRQKLQSYISYYHTQRRELTRWEAQVATEFVNPVFRKGEGVVAGPQVSGDGFVGLLPLLRSALQRAAEQEIREPSTVLQSSAKLTFVHGSSQSICEQVHQSQAKLLQVFQQVSPSSGSGLVVDKLATFLSACKAKLMNVGLMGERSKQQGEFKWTKRQTVLLFDFIVRASSEVTPVSSEDTAITSSAKRTINATQFVAAVVYWIAAMSLQRLTEPTSPAVLICEVRDSFDEFLTRAAFTLESTGRDELRALVLAPPIAAVLDSEWEALLLHCLKLESAASELTFDRFSTVMKECKMISSLFPAEHVQHVYAFVADDPQCKVRLDLLGQRELFVAVALCVEPSVWRPASERLSVFLKRLITTARSRDQKGRVKPRN